MSLKADAGGLLAKATDLRKVVNASDMICYLNYGTKCLAFYLKISPWRDGKGLFVCKYTNSKRGELRFLHRGCIVTKRNNKTIEQCVS